MTKSLLFGLACTLLVGGAARAASPAAVPDHYLVSGTLRPAPAGRYSIAAQIRPPKSPQAMEQRKRPQETQASRAPGPRFVVLATLRTKGSPLAASAPCAVNDLFKNGLE